ncbi:hypothetical protein [uncultured Ferrimonas sp.]|uniref:hypothetical protein n=1 Tax=uncultured Ferrimonas sp. TaxID=432640 RepID=UPI00260B6798|nr:hypothetical protein [uncultured Ferrimonas sp.]
MTPDSLSITQKGNNPIQIPQAQKRIIREWRSDWKQIQKMTNGEISIVAKALAKFLQGLLDKRTISAIDCQQLYALAMKNLSDSQKPLSLAELEQAGSNLAKALHDNQTIGKEAVTMLDFLHEHFEIVEV